MAVATSRNQCDMDEFLFTSIGRSKAWSRQDNIPVKLRLHLNHQRFDKENIVFSSLIQESESAVSVRVALA